jgi:hypothetical protein
MALFGDIGKFVEHTVGSVVNSTPFKVLFPVQFLANELTKFGINKVGSLVHGSTFSQVQGQPGGNYGVYLPQYPGSFSPYPNPYVDYHQGIADPYQSPQYMQGSSPWDSSTYSTTSSPGMQWDRSPEIYSGGSWEAALRSSIQGFR